MKKRRKEKGAAKTSPDRKHGAPKKFLLRRCDLMVLAAYESLAIGEKRRLEKEKKSRGWKRKRVAEKGHITATQKTDNIVVRGPFDLLSAQIKREKGKNLGKRRGRRKQQRKRSQRTEKIAGEGSNSLWEDHGWELERDVSSKVGGEKIRSDQPGEKSPRAATFQKGAKPPPVHRTPI